MEEYSPLPPKQPVRWDPILTCSSSNVHVLWGHLIQLRQKVRFVINMNKTVDNDIVHICAHKKKSVVWHIVSILYCIVLKPISWKHYNLSKEGKAVFHVYKCIQRIWLSKGFGSKCQPIKNYSTYYKTFALPAKISFPLLIVCF